MSNFTPGPWNKDKRQENLVGSDGTRVVIYGSGLSLAGLPDERSVANANLIAAAPRMHGTLVKAKAFLDLFEEVSEQAFGDWAGLRREIVEVLAEAEGKNGAR